MDLTSPSEAGFRMPAEWESHAATWLAWPHNSDTWPLNLPAAQEEFCLLAKAIRQDEPIVVLCSDAQLESCQSRIESASNDCYPAYFLNVPTNDAWIRDYGPTFVTSEQSCLAIDWQYNGWGAKYPPFDDDQKVVQRAMGKLPEGLAAAKGTEVHSSKLCIEGGAIEPDGEGTLLCTTSCALNPNRNRAWQLEQVESELKRCLGAQNIVWLDGEGIQGDDTDGHIDQIARFVPENKIVYASTHKRDSQFQALQNNFALLEESTHLEALGTELIPLPVPSPVVYRERRMPASYCNFYITNRKVIVPQFDQQPADSEALAILRDQFSLEREVIGLPSINLVTGLGSFHCLTQQQPKSKRIAGRTI